MEKFKKEEDKISLTIDRETMKKHPLYKDGMAKGIEEGELKENKMIKTLFKIFIKIVHFSQ